MKSQLVQPAPARLLSSIDVSGEELRVSTGIPALDKCLGANDDEPGGLAERSSLLISGAPGGGKSTLAACIANAAAKALYLHGEESERSVAKRWHRLKLTQDIWLAPLGEVEPALGDVRDVQPMVTVVDSIQTLSRDGRRNPEVQALAAEELLGQICGSGGVGVLVCHVSKDGKTHAGASSLPHVVDVHLHVEVNAKKGTRELQVRKNRNGRAGFAVPLVMSAFGIDVGVPTPLGGMVAARTQLEKAAEVAVENLLAGKSLNAYDFDLAGVAGGIWRAGLEMAAKRLQRDGHVVEAYKLQGRRTYRVVLEGSATLPDGVVAEKLVATVAAADEAATTEK